MGPTSRRRFVISSSAATLSLALPVPGAAQAFPARTVRLVVPYPPGGSTDILARLLAEKVSPILGQQAIVENRAGATGAIGAEAVAKSAPDGYTLLMGVNGPITIAPAVRSNLPYDSLRDFAPVLLVADAPKLLVVNPSIPADTVQAFVAWARPAIWPRRCWRRWAASRPRMCPSRAEHPRSPM
jgi:tripartite-type tricarboxylate transporter receptor subunit TctC